MSNRLIFQALSDLARQLEALNHTHGEVVPTQTADLPDLVELDKQVKRLSRELYKANTLAEAQVEQTGQALDSAQRVLEELVPEREDIARQARLDVIKALLPVLDSVEAGIINGVAQVKAIFPSAPDAARTLAAWLRGQRLLRERLLKLLEAENVQPIPTVGQPFDPYQHVAVKAVNNPLRESGVIVAEERRGYMCGDTVLRYADVIVNRHTSEPQR